MIVLAQIASYLGRWGGNNPWFWGPFRLGSTQFMRNLIEERPQTKGTTFELAEIVVSGEKRGSN